MPSVSEIKGRTDLSRFDNSWFDSGVSKFKWAMWHFCNAVFFQNPLSVWIGGKRFLLRIFGAKIGNGVVIKQRINIKYPWHLEIGDNAWIGEGVWIENHVKVSIGANCCLSQEAMLITGNHNYSKSAFDLEVGEIILEDGVWIGARATVCPGIKAASHSVLTAGSIATKNMDAYTIYQGNPAIAIRIRQITG